MSRVFRIFSNWRHRLTVAVGADVPAHIADDLVKLQHERVSGLIPVLYIAIALIANVAASASGGPFDIFYHVLLPFGFVGMGVYRCIVWYRRKSRPIDLVKARRQLRSTAWIALGLALIGGLWTLDAYYSTPETRRVLAPVFIFMITFACAICLTSIPRAAIGVLIAALTPPTIAMMMAIDPGIRAMGVSLMIVSVLLIGLIINSFAETVSSLKLRHELRHLAETDALTGLANRRAFEATFDETNSETGPDSPLAIVMIDLDGFKTANDQYGHAAGDAILVEAAHRLKVLCADAASVARLGGDEFAVLFAGNSSAAYYGAQREAIRKILCLPYQSDGAQIAITASVGIATTSETDVSLSSLMHRADRELYLEKHDVVGGKTAAQQ